MVGIGRIGRIAALAALTLTGSAGVLAAQATSGRGPSVLSPQGMSLEPFSAEYLQMGTTILVQATRSGDPPAMLHARFSWEGFDGDRMGYRLPGLEFAYRTIGPTSLVIEDSLAVLTRADAQDEPVAKVEPLTSRPFGGAFIYWLLPAFPLAEGLSIRMPSLDIVFPGATDFATRDIEFEVVGREHFRTDDGTEHDAWVVDTDIGDGVLRTFVSPRPPYVLKQVQVPAQGETQVIVGLKGLVEGK